MLYRPFSPGPFLSSSTLNHSAVQSVFSIYSPVQHTSSAVVFLSSAIVALHHANAAENCQIASLLLHPTAQGTRRAGTEESLASVIVKVKKEDTPDLLDVMAVNTNEETRHCLELEKHPKDFLKEAETSGVPWWNGTYMDFQAAINLCRTYGLDALEVQLRISKSTPEAKTGDVKPRGGIPKSDLQ